MRRVDVALVTLIGVWMPGCGQSNDLNSPTAVRLHALATAYLDYVAATGRGPGDSEQLRTHLKSLPSFVVGIEGDALDRLFLSERDGEAFSIKYGLLPSKLSKSSQFLIACEANGRKGKRLAVYLDGTVVCLDEAAWRKHGVPQ